MISPVSVYYIKGFGNSYVHARVRNPATGDYLIFSTGLFQSTVDETVKSYLSEFISTDSVESLYAANIDIPVGDYILELYANTKFLGCGDTLKPASQTSVDSIPTSPLLTNDSRLNNLDATISSRLSDKTGFSLTSAYDHAKDDTLGAIGTLSTAVGNIPTNPLLADDLRLNNLDATISSRLSALEVLAESYAADGSNATLSQILYMIWGMLSEKAKTADTTISTKRIDDGTVSMTFTLDNGIAPTSITRAT